MPLSIIPAPLALTGLPEAPADGSYRIVTDVNGTFLQLWNPTQSKWHTVSIAGGAGAEQLVLGPAEV
ncbi:MAG TPA: hypothetical protein VLH79_06805 [Chthonomonadales bacterium]|nr:hypothetical protein [Chthonomonadales bacterium]